MKRLDGNEFLKKFKEIHGDRYDYSKFEYKSLDIGAIIICKKHGEFLQSPRIHASGSNCPICINEDYLFKFIEKSKLMHGDRYDYSLAKYVAIKKPVKIICPVHGIFEQRPDNHMNGATCFKCAIKQKGENSRIPFSKFIESSNKIYNNFYDYSKFVYITSKTNGIIICPLHGDFLKCPNKHLSGQGCPICGFQVGLDKLTYSTKEFLDNLKNSRDDKGEYYDYSKVEYKNAHSDIIIVCPKHGEFKQLAYGHTNNQGCPKCVKKVSKPEMEFLDYLQIDDEYRQKRIKRYIVDALKDGIIYEFLGDYYHGNPYRFNPTDYNKTCHKTYGELYDFTFNKFDKLKQMGYNIKYVWENDWYKFKSKKDETLKLITH